MVLFKKRNQQLEINKLQNVTAEIKYIKSKQEGTAENEASSSADQPLYAIVHKDMPPSVPSKSAELMWHLESRDKCDDTTIVPQGTASDDIYTTPDSASSQTVETDDGISEAVYSEPIHPSLFTDAVENISDSQNPLPYTSIYTTPTHPLQRVKKYHQKSLEAIFERYMNLELDCLARLF